ncbi:surface lipoprotein assembly modifier [Hyphococcus sp.]|uniref:surface lipoprotein assembly modifier n=1 Tax=Hyphococcus sp. TaxID=2038636 RepID=UPI002082684B|nr:MAG: hypothetical protein DHS20C04_14980 [Marinicaulis sp.]
MINPAKIRVSVTAVTAALCILGVAAAQSPEEAAREEADRAFLEQQRRDAQQGELRAGAIPFEQILAAPENIQLNIAYARQQIIAGDLKEGVATLERVLLIDPTRHDVRVLYGLVLYRLGLFDRARYELELALDSGELPPALAAEAETYLGRIKYEQRLTRASLTLTTGVDYDNNRSQSPSSGQLLFLDTPLPAPGKIDDFAYIFSAQGRLLRDLGTQAGHTLHADASFYHSDKTKVDNLDLNAAALALGGTWYSGAWSISPRIRGGMYWLDGEDYLRSLGGEVEIAYRWNPKVTSYALVRGEDEDFRDTTNFGVASQRSGRRISARSGVAWRLSPTQTVTVEGLYSDKNAAVGYESYQRYGANVQHSWLLGRGAFSLIGFWAENSQYDMVDAFISPTILRDDWLYRGRVTIGAPISFFAPGLPEAIKDINLIAQYEYETVDSNILNFDYKAHKAAFLVSKRIAF